VHFGRKGRIGNLVELAVTKTKHLGEHIEPAMEEAVEEQKPYVKVWNLPAS